MWERFKLAEPPASFLPAYDRAVLQLLERPAEPLPGIRRLISELKRLGVPIAVASASLRAWVDATLRGLGLEDAFDATVSARDVASAQPGPDPYPTAPAHLGVAPERCLAVEDTLAGGRSAKAAGVFAVQ